MRLVCARKVPHLLSQMGANGKAKARAKARPSMGQARGQGKAKPKGKANAQGKKYGHGQAQPNRMCIQVLSARDGGAPSQARPCASMVHKLSRTT